MRRITILAAAALAALVLTGLAVAQLHASGTEAVSATFTATKVLRSNTHTCTGSDGTYEITRAAYAGELDSTNAALDGPVEIRVASVYNTTEKLGVVEGWFRTRDDDRFTHGRFQAVNTNGTLAGFVNGKVNRAFARLFGGFTAGWTSAGGFTDGKLGTGAATNAALLLGRACEGSKNKAVRLTVRGEIDSISSSSIAVKPADGSALQSCAITPKSPKTDGLAKGDKVAIHCATIDGTMTLVKVQKR